MTWRASNIQFTHRFEKYLDPNFFQHRVSGSKCSLPIHPTIHLLVLAQIHWFSIFNSFMMVIFLVGLVSMILMRTLRKDYARYSKEDELDDLVREPLSLPTHTLSLSLTC